MLRKGEPYYTKRVDHNVFNSLYLNLTKEEVVEIAHHPTDMIKNCQFGGYSMISPYCNELIDGTMKMFAPSAGVCYGFNFKNANFPSLYSMYGGRGFGFQLVVNIEG